jgi:hypothetical protein
MVKNYTLSDRVLQYGLAVLFVLLTSSSIRASHAQGMDLTYTCIGPNAYTVTLKFFRDCDGVSAPSSAVVSYSSASCGVSATVTLAQVGGAIDITPICPSANSSCGSNGQFGTEQYTYSGTLTLPANCGTDWVLGYSICCRNGIITTLNSPSNQSIYVGAQLNNTLSPCNSSPTFNNIPTPIVCNNQPVLYNHGVTDPDGDSLAFSLTACQQSAVTNVNYGGGFSAGNPLSTSTGVNIDPNTGQLSFTPNAIQVGVLCVLVREFRNGVQIGRVVRDMQFNVINCSNIPPVATGIDATIDFDTTVCIGQNFCFFTNGSDANSNNVTMTWNGGIIGASFVVSGNNTTSPVGTFCWTPTVNDVGSHFFTVTVTDDACLVTGTSTYTFEIVVPPTVNTVNAGPDVAYCLGGSANLSASSSGGVSYTWTPAAGLSCTNCQNPVANPTNTTVYTVTANFPNGCGLSDQVTVTVNPPPTVSIFPLNGDICPGGSIQLTATSPTAVAWNWSPSGPNSPNNIVSPGGTTNYSVTVTDANGCVNSAGPATVSVAVPATNVCNVIYATPTGSGSGTQASPTNLLNAISMAACNGTVIKLAIGTYTINSPITTILGGLTLEGGFDPSQSWRKTSQAGATTILRSTSNPEGAANNQRLVAMYMNGAANFRFQDVTVQTLGGSNNGMSSYGMHLTACSDYYFTRTQVIAGNGATGAAGVNGANGAVGFAGGTGGSGSNDGGNSAGFGGNGGTGGGAGGGAGGGGAAFGCGSCAGGAGGDSNNARAGGGGGGGGAGGESDNNGGNGGQGGGVNFGANTTTVGAGGDSDGCSDGDDGGAGTNGLAGAFGVDAGNGGAPSYSAGFFVTGSIGGTGTNGAGGRGGSGGGGGSGQGGTFCDDGSGSGGGGGSGGGQGGTGGTGGRGGGGSFAVYLFNNGANGRFDDARLVAGSAGNGGTRGIGGVGGNGGTRGLGNTYTNEVGAGGNGGTGGRGGDGGDGGAGQNGLAAQLRIDGGTAPVLQDINFNLPGQPIIFMENIACANTDIDFTGPNNLPWNLGLGSNPTNVSGTNVTTQYTTIGRKNIIYGADTYTGFANIIVLDTLAPNIGTSAPLVGGQYRICEGESINLFEQFPGINYFYHWNMDGGSIPNIYNGLTFASLTNVTFNTAGTYDITLFFDSDCCGASRMDTLTLIVDPQPNVAIAGANAICATDSVGVTLTASGANTYTWSPTTGLSTGTGNTVVALPTSTTTYTVQGANSQGTCFDQNTFTVTVNTLTLNPTSIPAGCAPPSGQAGVNVTGGSGNYAYNWSPGGFSTNPATSLVPGTYIVSVTDNITGCSDSIPVTVAPGPGTPVVTVQSVSPVSCNGLTDGQASVQTSGPGVYAYNWQTFPGLVNTGNNTANAGPLAPGDYLVTVFDLTVPGCVTTTLVNIPEPTPVVLNTLSIIDPPCPPGNQGSISINASGGNGPYAYNWGFTTGSNISNLAPGTYTVTVTDQNGCVATQAVNLACVLPVVYTYLEANPDNGAIRLDWETTEEHNNDRFDVLRSTNGVDFVKMGEVDAAAIEGEGAEYTFRDEQVQANVVYYYRLEQWDLNGSSHISNVVQAVLANVQAPEIIRVFPNPFSSMINIEINLPKSAELGIEVVNLLGQSTGFEQSFNLKAGRHTVELDLSKLSLGVYIGKVKVNGIIANTVKFVKAN